MAIRRRSARLRGKGRLTAKASKIKVPVGRTLADAASLTGSVSASGITPQVMPSAEWLQGGFWDHGVTAPEPAAAVIGGSVMLAGEAKVRRVWAQAGLMQDDV